MTDTWEALPLPPPHRPWRVLPTSHVHIPMAATNPIRSEMPETESATVSTIPTDIAIAASIRADLVPLLEQVCAILNRAKHHGLNVGFNCNPDNYGRHRPSSIDVAKPL